MDSKREFVVKCIYKSNIKDTDHKKRIMNEIKIHRSLNNRYICRMHHFFDTEKAIYIVLDPLAKVDLQQMLQDRTEKRLHEVEVQAIGKQLLPALAYLRNKRIVHRDLKLANICFTDEPNMEVRLVDFGSSYQLDSFDQRRYSRCGAPLYMSPEMVGMEYGVSFEHDIWSFGVCLYIMLVGKPPFVGVNAKQIFEKI